MMIQWPARTKPNIVPRIKRTAHPRNRPQDLLTTNQVTSSVNAAQRAEVARAAVVGPMIAPKERIIRAETQ